MTSPIGSENVFKTIFRLSPSIIIIAKMDGTICEISDASLKKFGMSREDVIGKTSRELGIWSSQDSSVTIDLLLREGRFRNLELKHRMKDGSEVTCLESGEIIQVGDERFFVVIVDDITAQKETLESLKSERDLSNKIIDSLPGFVYLYDESLRFIRWNNKVETITGYSHEEIANMSVLDFHAPEGRDIISQTIKEMPAEGDHSGESDIILKDQTIRTFLFNARWINYQGRRCILGTGVDITEKKRTEKELRRFAESLEDANIALRVLMNGRNNDQKDFEKKLQANINDLVMPYLKKLKQSNLDERNKNYVHILEKNLGDVLSPFLPDFLDQYKNLTPQEIQIVDLISKGKNTKEIAEILNASVNTIATHRNNIRKKLNLRHSKINLRSHLLPLK